MYSVKTLQQIGHYRSCNSLLLLYFTCFVTSQTPNCETKLSVIAHAAVTVYYHINLDPNLNPLHSRLYIKYYFNSAIQPNSSSPFRFISTFSMEIGVQMVNEFQKASSTTSRKSISARVTRLHVVITYAIKASDILTKTRNICSIEIRLPII